MPSLSVKDANGASQTIQTLPAVGQTTMSASLPVAIASDQGNLPVAPAVATASGNITTQNLVPAGAATAGSAVEITLAGANALGIQVTGTYTGALSLQVTLDGSTWKTVGGNPFIDVSTGGYLATITSALASVFQADVAGCLKARITGLAAMTGTAVVTLRGVNSPALVALDGPLQAGSAIIGALAANQSVNVAQYAGVTPDMNAGAASANTPRVALATNSSVNCAQMNGVAVSMGSGVNGTGVQRVSLATDQAALTVAGLISVKLDQTTPGTTNAVTVTPSAAVGASTTHHLISAASTNATSVKASAGTVNTIQVSNLNAAARYLKLYNKASAPTVGTDTPVMTILLPAGSNQVLAFGLGFRFSTGIAYAITTGIAVADTGAVSASEHSVGIVYT